MSARGSSATSTRSTAMKRSPACSPALAAAEPGVTDSTVGFPTGTPIQKIAAKMITARTMFTAGPAAIVAIFFQAGML